MKPDRFKRERVQKRTGTCTDYGSKLQWLYDSELWLSYTHSLIKPVNYNRHLKLV